MPISKLTVNLVNISSESVGPAEVHLDGDRIKKIISQPGTAQPGVPFMLPGFVDAHVHIESSMLVPSEFARLAVVHGTVATVSDPHEIANVLGEAGVAFMLENGKKVPFGFFFGAPSCVPATAFETAGAALDARAVEKLLDRDDILYLSEMMNFPGVLNGDPEVLAKITAARRKGKPVDGHAPGLRGAEARLYAEAGRPGEAVISTDHECFTRAEALDKLAAGMQIIIREGSAARNFEALVELLRDYPERMMFCSDDKHPDSLVQGHINLLVKRALAKGIPLFNVLRAACINPVVHYRLPVGLLREGDSADFILVRDLESFDILGTWVKGVCVAENGKTRISSVPVTPLNHFNCGLKAAEDFGIHAKESSRALKVIDAVDGELVTGKSTFLPRQRGDFWEADVAQDVLKIAVVNRYREAPVALAFIRNFGIKAGAIASSVSHDSHNMIAVGTDDPSLARAVNLLVEAKGGISAVSAGSEVVLPLPVAGLMSAEDGYRVAEQYGRLDQAAKQMGSALRAPFMTLSFMALLVIPHLKLSDRGLFDGDVFKFTTLQG